MKFYRKLLPCYYTSQYALGHSKLIHCFPFPAHMLFICRIIQFIIHKLHSLVRLKEITWTIKEPYARMAGTIVNICVCLLSVQKIYITTLDNRFSERRPTLVQQLLYTSNIQPHVVGSSETSYDVESAQVGPCKDCLDMVDLGLQICQVVENFGRYVKYVANCSRSSMTTLTLVELSLWSWTLAIRLKSRSLGPFMRRPCQKVLLFGWIWAYLCVLCKRSAIYVCWSISSMSWLFSSPCCEK